MLTDSVPLGTRQGFDVAYLKARFFLAAIYQPLKRLATLVTPRWGFVLQLVLRRVEANKVRASILAKLEVVIKEAMLVCMASYI